MTGIVVCVAVVVSKIIGVDLRRDGATGVECQDTPIRYLIQGVTVGVIELHIQAFALMHHRSHESAVIAGRRGADFCHCSECGRWSRSRIGCASERVNAAILNRFVVTEIADVLNLKCVVMRKFVLDFQTPLRIGWVLQMRCDWS